MSELETTLCDIFSFGESFGERWYRFIRELAEAINAGMVSMTTIIMPIIDIPAPGPGVFPDRRLSIFSGQTGEHKYLCAKAAAWLESRGIEWQPDGWYCGHIADVSAKDKSVVVECGYARAEKVLNALNQHDMGVLVFPYVSDVGYLFERTAIYRPVEKIANAGIFDG